MFTYRIILENILLPLGDMLLRTSFIRNLKKLRRIVCLGEESLHDLQRMNLQNVLEFATSNSKYYKNLKISQNPDPFLRIKEFPILTKQTLLDEQVNLITKPLHKLLRQSSSGSSGIQSVVFWTESERSLHRATQILWWEWAGYKIGMPIIQTGMTPRRGTIKSVKDFLFKTYYFVAFVPDKKFFIKALRWASTKTNVFLGGYASSLFVLSEMARTHNIDIKFAGAVSWGDKLFPHYKNAINSTFNTCIKETYGTSEGMMIAAQKDLDYMYIMTPNVYLEILDDDGNEVPDGCMGNVVVTSLVAKGMPLIRYKIGDLAIKLPKDEYPSCRELALPLLKKVIGRDTDLVKTANGKTMVVHTFTAIFEYFPEIEQFCVIQEDLNSLIIQYIPRNSFKIEILQQIENKIQEYLLEPGYKIYFKEVSFIESTPSGKPQIIISKI